MPGSNCLSRSFLPEILEHLQVFFGAVCCLFFYFLFFLFCSCFFFFIAKAERGYFKQSVVHFQLAPHMEIALPGSFGRESWHAQDGCICTFYVSQQIDSAFRTFCC